MTPSPRNVSVAIIMSTSLSAQPFFLVVSSRKHAESKFVFPKGGIEKGEDSVQASIRESWEESGLIEGSAIHLTQLLIVPCTTPHPKSPTQDSTHTNFIPNSIYHFELFVLPGVKESALASEWPEKLERKSREWIQGWENILKVVDWGKRAEVMKQALLIAKARME